MPPRVLVLLSCGLLVACSSESPRIDLPDRGSPAVQQEEARIGDVLAADTSGKLLGRPLAGPAACAVRLLREVGDVDYVYARCTAGEAGVAVPLRIQGREITVPRDGSEYATSIRRIFPPDIAEALISDEQRYKP